MVPLRLVVKDVLAREAGLEVSEMVPVRQREVLEVAAQLVIPLQVMDGLAEEVVTQVAGRAKIEAPVTDSMEAEVVAITLEL